MQLSISSPGLDLNTDQVQQIERDLEKIDRRFKTPDQAMARLRVSNGKPSEGYSVLLEVDYHRHHFLAKSKGSDMGQTVRDAREDILRQISDTSRGGHSSYTKGQ